METRMSKQDRETAERKALEQETNQARETGMLSRRERRALASTERKIRKLDRKIESLEGGDDD